MATISVSSGSYIRPYRNVRVRRFPVAVSQTILVGDPIILSTTTDLGQRVAKAGTDPATDRSFIGFACEAITTTSTYVAATDKVLVWLATQEAEFLVHCENAAAIDNDDIGVEYGIVADATNLIYRLDRSETSAKIFRVLELVDAHGDVNGRLVVHVIAPERLYHD
jgi:hypothetical protein